MESDFAENELGITEMMVRCYTFKRNRLRKMHHYFFPDVTRFWICTCLINRLVTIGELIQSQCKPTVSISSVRLKIGASIQYNRT